MDYQVDLDIELYVAPKNFRPLLDRINSLYDVGGMHVYSGVADAPKGGWATLEGAFMAWRYNAFVDITGHLCINKFTSCKWGDDEFFFTQIAEFIEDGGEVTVYGNRSDIWKYDFQGGRVARFNGMIEWEFDEDINCNNLD